MWIKDSDRTRNPVEAHLAHIRASSKHEESLDVDRRKTYLARVKLMGCLSMLRIVFHWFLSAMYLVLVTSCDRVALWIVVPLFEQSNQGRTFREAFFRFYKDHFRFR